MGRYVDPPPVKGKQALVGMVKNKIKADLIYNSLFPEQQAAIKDKCRYKVLLTTRRSGKTTSIVADFLIKALMNPHTTYCYIALTFRSAKKIAWGILKKFNRDYDLGMRFQEAQLTAVLNNGSMIDLVGGDSPTLGDRMYGQKLAGCAIDEAAFFSISLQDLIKDNLAPTLVDLQGTMWLASIPGRFPSGLFFYLTEQFDYKINFSGATPVNRSECLTASRWSFHSWTYKENPYTAKLMEKELQDELASNPNALKDPRILRGYLKCWVTSKSALVYRYDPDVNVDEKWEPTKETEYVMAIDLGYRDNTSVVVLAYIPERPTIWIVDMWKDNQVLLDVVAEQIRSYMNVYGDNIDIVCDPAHKYIFEELRRGHSLPIMEAEKARKYEAIQVMNSSMLRGDIKVIDPSPKTNPLVEEWTRLRWKTLPSGKKMEQPGQTNDCSDAVLTGFRHVLHYTDLHYEEDVRTPSEVKEDELIEILEAECINGNSGWGTF